MLSEHLRRLEDESIFIIREVAAEFGNPVVLYSGGKDSSVLLHLVHKAFFPAPIPFPFLHIASGWDFVAVLNHRDRIIRQYSLRLLVEQSDVPSLRDPFTADSGEYSRIRLTEPLKAALDRHAFDAAIGGGRRDEERARAKERIFSRRGHGHSWNPREQRPEFGTLFNCQLAPGETMRVFPLSNWTESDVWRYIEASSIPIVDLYFAAERPVVERNGMTIVVGDEHSPLMSEARLRRVRFRTLGCWPLTGAVDGDARTVGEILEEINASKFSERQGRLVDSAAQASMERKKREGYF